MALEKPRTHGKRSSVAFEEERTWVTFYRRVGRDAAIASEMLAQLDMDPELKHAHLALYLCCKESLRTYKARQARNKRIGQFVRWFCHGLFVAPVHAARRALRQGGSIAVECLPEIAKEPAVPRVRQLTREAEFAQADSAFKSRHALPGEAPARSDAEPTSRDESPSGATRKVA